MKAHNYSLIALLLGSAGCQLIGGIEKAEYDPNWEDTAGDGDSSSGDGDSNSGDGDSSSGDGDSNSGDGDGDEQLDVPGLRGAKFSRDSCSTDIDLSATNFKSCLYRISCEPDVPTFTLGSCLTFDYLHSYPAEACSQGASSCEDIYECIHRSPKTSAHESACADSSEIYLVYGEVCEGTCTGTCDYGTCDGITSYGDACDGECLGECVGTCSPADYKKWACDGDWAVDCSDGGLSYNCATRNAVCGEALATSSVDDGGCIPSSMDEITCEAGENSDARCSGSTFYWCADGEVWGLDCDAACVEGEDGAYCSLASETCSASAASCKGDTIEFCDADLLYSEHSCAENGLKCVATDGGGVDCVADGCDSSSCTETCIDGTTLQFCVGGAEIEVDCTEYGFDSCETFDSGYGDSARCVLGAAASGL